MWPRYGRLMCFILGICMAFAGSAAAQWTGELLPGQPLHGEVTDAEPLARYQIISSTLNTYTLTVSAADDAFIPRLRVTDVMGETLLVVENDTRLSTLDVIIEIPEPGPYFVHVNGQEGSTGAFVINLDLGPVAPGAVLLRPGEIAHGVVSEALPERVYEINTSVEGDLLLLVRGEDGDLPEVTLRAEIVDRVAGTGNPLLKAVAFVLSRGDSVYSLTLVHADSDTKQAYSVCLMPVVALADCSFDERQDDPTA